MRGLLSLCVLWSAGSVAGSETLIGAKVEQIAGSATEYTGCAAKLSMSVSLPACTYPNYVHFDCDGSANSTTKAASNAMFNLIQLAMSLTSASNCPRASYERGVSRELRERLLTGVPFFAARVRL